MRIVWRRAAIRDLEAVRAYVARDKPRAANRLAVDLLTAVEQLGTFPGSGRPGRIGGTRELVSAPYIIPYRVIGDEVRILRVLHGAIRWP